VARRSWFPIAEFEPRLNAPSLRMAVEGVAIFSDREKIVG